jgi:NAD(P)-dependent dehydrogenase (short-subunit alcohol dehydrogenase family)
VHAAFGHIGEDEGVSIEETTEAELVQFVQDSVTAAFLTVRTVLPALKAGTGRAVFIVADWGLPQHNLLLSGEIDGEAVGSQAFVAAKYAIAGLANSLELQSGIGVTGLYPGAVASLSGTDSSGKPVFLTLDSSEEDIRAAGYDDPDAVIPLVDIVDCVDLAIASRSVIRTIGLKPRNPAYIGF